MSSRHEKKPARRVGPCSGLADGVAQDRSAAVLVEAEQPRRWCGALHCKRSRLDVLHRWNAGRGGSECILQRRVQVALDEVPRRPSTYLLLDVTIDAGQV